MSNLRRQLDEIKRAHAEEMALLDRLKSNQPEDVDLEARAESLRDLEIAGEVDQRVINRLEYILAGYQTTALERLGHVLGWAGNGLAIVVAAIALFWGTIATKNDQLVIVVGGVVLTALIYALGRALRYIFAGR